MVFIMRRKLHFSCQCTVIKTIEIHNWDTHGQCLNRFKISMTLKTETSAQLSQFIHMLIQVFLEF